MQVGGMYNLLIVLRNILLVLLILSFLGYTLIVFRQKILLKNNIIFINKKSINEELLNRANLKYFKIDNLKVKSGDEIKIKTKRNKKREGILIGVSEREGLVLIVTHDDRVEEYEITDIKSVKLISRYGYFFWYILDWWWLNNEQ